jgi:hypothetical protein
LTDAIDLPPEYIEALLWSMCVRLQMSYGLPSRPDHVMAMHQSVAVVSAANTQIGTLVSPIGSRRGGSLAAGSSPGFMSGGMA